MNVVTSNLLVKSRAVHSGYTTKDGKDRLPQPCRDLAGSVPVIVEPLSADLKIPQSSLEGVLRRDRPGHQSAEDGDEEEDQDADQSNLNSHSEHFTRGVEHLI